MKTESILKTSYSGMMYSHDFQLWYTYLKRRIQQEWRPAELSFLLGKADHAYLDFEKMYQVRSFLTQESILLDRIYMSSCIEPMEFHRERYEVTEERLVRLHIEEHEVRWHYSIEIPCSLSRKKSLQLHCNLRNGKLKKMSSLNRMRCYMCAKRLKGYWVWNSLGMVQLLGNCFGKLRKRDRFISRFIQGI